VSCSLVLAAEWGPVGVWAGAIATFLAALIALAGSVGRFDRYRAPRLRVTFEQTEPWCRAGEHPVEGEVLWVRVGIENVGTQPARGCVGRMVGVFADNADTVERALPSMSAPTRRPSRFACSIATGERKRTR
jgi:hypothetical protein